MKFEGAGWSDADSSKATDLTNCRIRGIVKNNDDRYIYLELTSGNRFSRKDTGLSLKEYENKYPYEQYIFIDHCFYLDVPKDHYNNYSEELKSLDRKPFYYLPYSKDGVLHILNEYLKCDFKDIEVVNDNYRVHSEIDKMGFYESQYDQNIIKPNLNNDDLDDFSEQNINI